MTRLATTLSFISLTIVIGSCSGVCAEQPPDTNRGHVLVDHPSHPLTLADVEQMAMSNNPTLVQAAAKIEAARGRTVQAGLYPNPTIGYSGEEIGAEATAGQQGVFIDQVIVTKGKLRLNRAKFAQEITQAEWQALAQQYRVVNGVRLRFYEVLALEQLTQVQTELLKIADDAVRTTEELMNVGQANRPDLLQARVEARRQRVALAAARNRYEAKWRELAAYVGNPYLALTPLEGDLEERSPPLDWDTTLAHILEASPEIQIARAEIVRSQLSLQRERVEPIPNINVRAGTQYNYESNDQQAMVEIGVRLPLWNRNQGKIQAAQSELNRAQADLPRVELSLRERLARTFSRYQTALAEVEQYRGRTLEDGILESGSLAEAEEAYASYRDSFAKRRAAYPQVLVAQRDYFQVSVAYVEALADLRRLEVAIRGLLLVDGLDEPAGPPGEGDRPRNAREGMPEEFSDPIRSRNSRGLED